MRTREILRKARQVREQEHRLRSSLRLQTLSEIQEFIRDRGIVSILGGNELPSVISAILGREWKPTGKGFTSWEDWWSLKISGQSAGRALGQLERTEDILSTRIFRQSKTLVSERLWPVLDPIVKHYWELAANHQILSEIEWKILKLLDSKGPTRTDHLRSQLDLEGKQFTGRFHRALSRLEAYGLILGYEDPKPERHLHANIWQVWTRRVHVDKNPSSYQEALATLLEKTIDACVLAPAGGIGKWFQWNGHLTEAAGDLARNKKILEVDEFLVAARIGAP
jgi:hypothetical protein